MVQSVKVALGVLVEDRGGGRCVLIARRPQGAVLGGFWELPGGKVEPDETLEECVRREFLEEVGLEVSVTGAMAAVEHTYDHAHVRLHAFVCARVSGEPANLQVSEHRWVGPAELGDYTFPPANAPLMRHVEAVLEP